MLNSDEIAALDDLKNALKEVKNEISRTNNSNRTSLKFDAGGAGVWIATTACVVTLLVAGSVAAVTAIWLSREFNRIDSTFAELKNTDDVQDAYINKLRTQQQETKK